ncbi:PQQ-dependent sugar dehydrogenase [Nitratireductor sp. GCM10026969]|uniref:PQQ-dependent sugar dehydrogenase n=1 Tax=Nitratireductor sp. GCM10026969 TaxID=3252645 RepID=UPI003611BD3A
MQRLPSIALFSAVLVAAAHAQDQGADQQAGPSWQDTISVARPGESGTLPGSPSIELREVTGDLIDPVNVVSAKDDTGRLFVVERHGVVRIVENGSLVEQPFMDISDIVLPYFLEQGLYDIEFHPDFENNGYVYAHFAETLRNGDSLIVRYTVSSDSPNQIDPESSKLIMQIDQPWANHNGGELAFGPDGYLYIGSGDGGWEGDPLEAGQDLSTLLGKLLRIDVDVPEDSYQAYAIPADNPFARQAGIVELFGITEEEFAQIHTEARPEIWAYGLRNPWKFHFDSETGDLYVAEVGQNHWEEINFQPADSQGGENYGWDFLMGTHCFPIEEEECAQVGVLPVAEYDHEQGCSVIGLGVYHGGEIEGLDGVYLAGDYCAGTIWGLARGEDDQWVFQELLASGVQLAGGGTDEDGNLYVTSCSCNYGGPLPQENPPGTLWQVVAASDQDSDTNGTTQQ